MKKFIKISCVLLAFIAMSVCCQAQYKMDSDGKTLRNESNSSIGRIDNDGYTIRKDNNSAVGRVDSDGKTIRNAANSSVLRIDGNDIRNAQNSVVAHMSDVLHNIQGAKSETIYVALWWFLVKGNK